MTLGSHRSELNTWRLTSPNVHRIGKCKCNKNHHYSIAIQNHGKICVQLFGIQIQKYNEKDWVSNVTQLKKRNEKPGLRNLWPALKCGCKGEKYLLDQWPYLSIFTKNWFWDTNTYSQFCREQFLEPAFYS